MGSSLEVPPSHRVQLRTSMRTHVAVGSESGLVFLGNLIPSVPILASSRPSACITPPLERSPRAARPGTLSSIAADFGRFGSASPPIDRLQQLPELPPQRCPTSQRRPHRAMHILGRGALHEAGAVPRRLRRPAGRAPREVGATVKALTSGGRCVSSPLQSSNNNKNNNTYNMCFANHGDDEPLPTPT